MTVFVITPPPPPPLPSDPTPSGRLPCCLADLTSPPPPPSPFSSRASSVSALCALLAPGWILRGWTMGRTASWTRLNLGAGPSRICTTPTASPSATRWCAPPASPSSGTYSWCGSPSHVAAALTCERCQLFVVNASPDVSCLCWSM